LKGPKGRNVEAKAIRPGTRRPDGSRGLKGRNKMDFVPQSLSNVLIHLVFSTKDRVPNLSEPIRRKLYPYLSERFATKVVR